MHISYTITPKNIELIAQESAQIKMKGNVSYILERIMVSAIFSIAVSALILSNLARSDQEVQYTFMLGVLLFSSTVMVYPHISQRNIQFNIQQKVKNGEFNNIIGQHEIILDKDYYTHIYKGVEARTKWPNISQINTHNFYISVFFGDQEDNIPLYAFSNQTEMLSFIEEANTYRQRAQ